MRNPDTRSALGEYRYPVDYVKFENGKYFADEDVVTRTQQTYPQFRDFKLANGKVELLPQVEKMSKRYYNVVTPDLICDEFGADTLRMYEMFLGPLEAHKPWNT